MSQEFHDISSATEFVLHCHQMFQTDPYAYPMFAMAQAMKHGSELQRDILIEGFENRTLGEIVVLLDKEISVSTAAADAIEHIVDSFQGDDREIEKILNLEKGFLSEMRSRIENVKKPFLVDSQASPAPGFSVFDPQSQNDNVLTDEVNAPSGGAITR